MAVRDLLNKTGDAIKDMAKSLLKKYAPYIAIVAAGACIIVVVVAACVGAFASGGSGLSLGFMPLSGDYDVYTESTNSAPVISDLETLKKAFSGYPTNSKLLAEAQTFLDMQEKYKVNAIFAAAVSIQETTAGTKGSFAKDGHNWFNYVKIPGIDQLEGYLGTMDRWCKWDSDRNGIMGFGYYISQHKSFYFSQGEYTVSAIGSHYCDPPDNWIVAVKGFMTQLYTAAGIRQSIEFNGDFLDAARVCHKYFEDNKFTYVQGNEIPYPNGTTHTDCSAYVTWALYEYGYEELGGHQKTSGWYRNEDNWKGYGWQKINIDDVQPGDIISMDGHVEIYAGDNYTLNCGSKKAIQRPQTETPYASRASLIDYYRGRGGFGIRVTPKGE